MQRVIYKGDTPLGFWLNKKAYTSAEIILVLLLSCTGSVVGEPDTKDPDVIACIYLDTVTEVQGILSLKVLIIMIIGWAKKYTLLINQLFC